MSSEEGSTSIFAELPELPGFPGPADTLFSTGEDWWNNACLNWSSSDWTLYASGYKEAADVLVQEVEKRSASLDTLVYPVLFLYRQYLELQLKVMTRTVRRLLDRDPVMPTGHRIELLWRDLDALLREAFPDESTQELVDLGRLIQQFAAVDPLATAFRYPVDKSGNPSLPGMRYLNLRNVKEVMAKMAMLLGGAHDQAYEHLQWKLEMEREFSDY